MAGEAQGMGEVGQMGPGAESSHLSPGTRASFGEGNVEAEAEDGLR